MRFRRVHPHIEDSRWPTDESGSLYEAKTAFVVSEGADTTMADVSVMDSTAAIGDGFTDVHGRHQLPSVYCATSGNWMALATGCDVHSIDITVDIAYKTCFAFTGERQVMGMAFVPKAHVLVVVLDNGCIGFCFMNGEMNEMQLLNKEMSACSIVFSDDNRTMCIAEEAGTLSFFAMPDFIAAAPTKQSELILDISSLCAPVELPSHFIVFFMGNFMAVPMNSNGTLKSISLLPSAKVEEVTPLYHDALSAAVVGGMLVVLSSDNILNYYDLTLLPVATRKVQVDEQVVRFWFFDVDRAGMIEGDTKMALLVKNDFEYKMQIHSFDNPNMFSMAATEKTFVMPKTKPGGDGNIICVDPFGIKRPECVAIELIYEAQPSMRLKRLVDNAKFDEAELFAQKHGLNLQCVYVARISHIVKEGEISGKEYDELLTYLRKIDDEHAADFCLIALGAVYDYNYIVGLLGFSEGLKLKDEQIQLSLSQYRYDLASYRMLFEPDASFTTDSEWTLFRRSDAHLIYFNQFCRTGDILKARILWQRYPTEVPLCASNDFKALLNAFVECINAKPGKSDAVAEFVEMELIPFVSAEATHNLENADIVHFVINIALSLESLEPARYPENALQFAQCLRKAFERLQEQASSPVEQGNMAYVMSLLEIASTDESKPSGQLNQMIHQLTKLVELYRTYNCRMPFKEFTENDHKSIALRILDRVKSVSEVGEYIRQFPFAYMSQYYLDKDSTLFDYIQEQDSQWERVCLKVLESINNAGMRCEALIGILKKAQLPWSKQLQSYVEKIKSSTDVEKSLLTVLQNECIRAQIGQLFMAYQIPLDCRNNLSYENGVISTIQFMFMNEEKEITRKIADSHKVIELAKEIHSGIRFTADQSYMHFADVILRALSDDSEEKTMQRMVDLFRSIKSNELRLKVAKEVTVLLNAMTTPSILSKSLIARRVLDLNFFMRFVQKFLPNNTESRQLTAKLRKVLALHCDYGIYIGLNEIDNNEKSSQDKSGGPHLDKFVSHSPKDLEKAISLGKLLALPLYDIFHVIIENHLRSRNVGLSMAALRAMTEIEVCPTRSHLTLALKACKCTLAVVSLIAKETLERKDDDVVEILDVMSAFRSVLPILVSWSTQLESVMDQQSFTNEFCLISRYMELCHQVCGCCESLSERQTDKTKLYQIRSDVGTFLPHHEGTVMEPSPLICTLAYVAASVETFNTQDEMTDLSQEDEQKMNDYIQRWDELFVSLNVQSLHLVEIHARQFASTLPCFRSSRGLEMDLQRLVCNVCKKILVNSPPDYWLAVRLIMCLSHEGIKELFAELQKWSRSKQNARIILNLIVISQYVFLVIGDNTHHKQLCVWFETSKWKKELGKLGVQLSTSKIRSEALLDLLPDFLKALVPPSVIKEYCATFKFNANSILLHYAFALCKLVAGNEKADYGQERLDRTLRMASLALQLIDCDGANAPYDEVINTVEQLCPYSYETIGLLVKQMEIWLEDNQQSPQKEAARETIEQYGIMLAFLSEMERKSDITKEEIMWYTKRKNGDVEINMANNPLKLMSFTQTSEGSDNSMNNAIFNFQRQEGHLPDFPAASARRFPFHVFFIKTNDGKQHVLMPIIRHELTCSNVESWIALCERRPLCSRTYLLSLAISADFSNLAKHGRDIKEEELFVMYELISKASSPPVLLESLIVQINSLPLCTAQLSAIRLMHDIAQNTLKNGGLDEDDQAKLESVEEITARNLASFSTTLLLQKHGLLNAASANMTNNGPAVISYILSEAIRWNDHDDIELKLKVVHDIAEAHNLRVDEIYNDLLDKWLTNANDGDELYSDPDATIVFGSSMTETPNGENDDLVLALPILDSSVTRIVRLLNACEDPKAQKLVSHYSQSQANYTIILRIACCVLRYYNDEQLMETFGSTRLKICERLTTILQERVLKISRVDLPLESLQSRSTDMFRRLLSAQSTYRHTAEIGHLLACAVLDKNITDISIIEQVAQRVFQLRQKKHLFALLKHARKLAEVKTMKNIVTYYVRTFEWMFDEIDKDNASATAEVLNLAYFLIGCPVEGRNHFNQPKQLVAPVLPAASALIAIASSATFS